MNIGYAAWKMLSKPEAKFAYLIPSHNAAKSAFQMLLDALKGHEDEFVEIHRGNCRLFLKNHSGIIITSNPMVYCRGYSCNVALVENFNLKDQDSFVGAFAVALSARNGKGVLAVGAEQLDLLGEPDLKMIYQPKEIKMDKFVVGVIGTQNTGKSTFIKDILDFYHSTPRQFQTVGCDYRKKVEEAGLQINRKGNLEAQKIICDTLIEQIDIIRSMPDGNYITDRSPIDSYVYTKYLFKHNPELGIKQSDMDEMLMKVKGSLGGYDRLIFLDLDNCKNVEVVDDKFRDTNLDYRREIDQLFKEAFNEIGWDTMGKLLYSGISGTREERLAQFHQMFSNEVN